MSVRDTRQPLVSGPLPTRGVGGFWRGLLVFILLACVATLAGLFHRQAAQLQATRELLEDLTRRIDLQAQASDHAAAEQRQLDAGLQGDIHQLSASMGGDLHRQWLRQQVANNLRLTQQHLVLTRDIAGSLALLEAADRQLSTSAADDFSPLHQAITNDENTLRAVHAVDVPAIYRQLNSLDHELAGLVVPATAGNEAAAPVATSAPVAAADGSAGGLVNQGWARLRALIVVRRYDSPVRPLLSDSERLLVVQNLRVHVAQAELALLRGDDATYQLSLKTTDEDFDRWFKSLRAADYQRLRGILQALRAQSVQADVPALTSLAMVDAQPEPQAVSGAGR